MKRKTKLVNVLIMNIFTCISLCLTAQLLAIAHGNADGFSWPSFLLNLCVAYIVSGVVGMTVPTAEFGQWVCRKLYVKPGPAMGVVMAASVGLVFTAILSTVMTYLNAVILGGLGLVPFFFGLLRDFIPMWLISAIVGWITANPVMKLSFQLTGEKCRKAFLLLRSAWNYRTS